MISWDEFIKTPPEVLLIDLEIMNTEGDYQAWLEKSTDNKLSGIKMPKRVK
jgi:hypothetical protein